MRRSVPYGFMLLAGVALLFGGLRKATASVVFTPQPGNGPFADGSSGFVNTNDLIDVLGPFLFLEFLTRQER